MEQKWLQMRLAECLNTFRAQHGDESKWTPEEWVWHDRLVERVRGDALDRGRES
jgi:hypothetical protein